VRAKAGLPTHVYKEANEICQDAYGEWARNIEYP
jgi:hypothetical protein